MKTRWMSLVVVFLISAAALFGQDPAKAPYPKILLVISDSAEEPEGRTGLEAVLSRMKGQRPQGLRWIGAQAVAGELGKTVAMFLLDRYGDTIGVIEKINATSKSFPEAQRPILRSTIYELDGEASFDGSKIPWNEATAFAFNHVLLRRGTPDAYREQQVIAAQLLTRAKVNDEVWIGYQLRFGAQTPAYLFVTPMRGIGDLDVDMSGRQQLFTPEQDRARVDALRLSVISDMHEILTVRKEISSTP
jgi:hypothetical protein